MREEMGRSEKLLNLAPSSRVFFELRFEQTHCHSCKSRGPRDCRVCRAEPCCEPGRRRRWPRAFLLCPGDVLCPALALDCSSTEALEN